MIITSSADSFPTDSPEAVSKAKEAVEAASRVVEGSWRAAATELIAKVGRQRAIQFSLLIPDSDCAGCDGPGRRVWQIAALFAVRAPRCRIRQAQGGGGGSA